MLRLKDVGQFLDLSMATMYRLIKDGSFPHPTKVGKRAVRSRLDVVSKTFSGRVRRTQPAAASAMSSRESLYSNPMGGTLYFIERCPK